MRWSSEAPRARIMKSATVQPFLLAVAPEEHSHGGPVESTPWDGRERRARSQPEPWDGRERRSGRELVTAREEGYRDGYESGRRDAENEIGATRDDLERALSAVRAAAAQLDAEREQAMQVAEEEIAALAFSVAEAVLQRELVLSAEPGRQAVARALALVPSEVDVVLRLHPDDAAQVTAVPEDGRRVTIVADPMVERGGCVADAGACRIDTQVGTALARVREVLCSGENR